MTETTTEQCQKCQEGQLIGGGGDGELDEEEEDVIDETFACVLADGDQAAGPELGFHPAHEEVGG